MRTHTPGPWLIEPTDTSKAIVTDDCVICEMAVWAYEHQKEIEANTLLIAAAPNLLEACRRFSGVMNLLGYENDTTAEFGRAAIAKATGVSNEPDDH